MSGDTREAILNQLEILLGTISGLTAYRDRGDLGSMQLPAAIILDGQEDLAMDEDVARKKSVYFPPVIMSLKPEIIVIAHERGDASNLYLEQANGQMIFAPIGPELSSWRVAVIDAVTNDSTLYGLLAPMGQILYHGCETDMTGFSDTLLGRLLMKFSFRYWLVPPR